MSKFQEEYNIAHESFEDFILVIFVLVDDLYKKVAPNQVKYRPNVDKALGVSKKVCKKTYSDKIIMGGFVYG